MNRWVLAAACCLAVIAAALLAGPHLPDGTDPPGGIVLIGLSWVGFGLAAWMLPRTPRRTGTVLVLAGAIGLSLAAGFGPPRSSDDLYRYLWDGRVQAAGIDPYRYAPAAPELAGLRDPYLWPATSHWCVADGAKDAQTGADLASGCTLINRPTVHTIYPPAAEGLFLAVHALSPNETGYRGIRLLGAVAAFGVTVLLMWGLHRTGGDPRRAALWAWCPAVLLEAVNNAHIDVVAAGLVAAALVVLAGARRWRSTIAAGSLLGLAVAVKIVPLAVLPATLRRRPIAVLASAAGVVSALYVPHLLAVGTTALGYLGGYAREEGYTDGRRFVLLPVPTGWATVVAALAIGVAGYAAWRTARPESPWHAAALSTGVLLLITAPVYPWYALLLVVLVALGARAEWLAVVAAGYAAQHASELGLTNWAGSAIGYGLAGAVVVLGWLIHRRATLRPQGPVSLSADRFREAATAFQGSSGGIHRDSGRAGR